MMLFAAFAVVFACTSVGFAQVRPPMVGGYKAVSVKDAGVVGAANFAVSNYSEKNETSLEIVRIHKAERQIVQGSNYRLCVEVKIIEAEAEDAEAEAEDEENVETQLVQVVVYQDLKRAYKAGAWKPDGCTAAK